jgi:hypothetical protein
LSAILILATIIVDEVFSPDKNQKVTPGFMQGIAQSCLHMVKKHITPPKSGPRFPVLHITKFQYRVKLKCQQI